MSCPEVSAREKEETELLGSSISQEEKAAGRREWFDPELKLLLFAFVKHTLNTAGSLTAVIKGVTVEVMQTLPACHDEDKPEGSCSYAPTLSNHLSVSRMTSQVCAVEVRAHMLLLCLQRHQLNQSDPDPVIHF